MKKQYQTPNICFESFSLCNNIALSCEVKSHTPEQGTCGFTLGTRVIFLEDVVGCAKKVEDGSMYDGLCYHTPIEANNLFNS